jgi:hypothetical protein
MTKRLEEAFAEAASLPPAQQDAMAGWLLEELRAERRWDRALSRSQDAVAPVY